MTSATSPNTAALDQSTGSRRGTAASVERIMPVEYSPAVTSTPSTPSANCAKLVPNSDRLTAVGVGEVRVQLPAGCDAGLVPRGGDHTEAPAGTADRVPE